MNNINIIKKSMIKAFEIVFLQIVLVTLFPFVPPIWVWGYIVIVMLLYELILSE